MAFTLELGATAPDFNLPGVDGNHYSLNSFSSFKALTIVFACNHCPFVIGMEDRLNEFYGAFHDRGVGLISINSNESDNHPGDSFEHMVQRAKDKGFQFPYLRDENQSAALAYGALRTPHFYLFDNSRKLSYTGRMDDNPRDPNLVTTSDLCDAVEEMLSNRKISRPLTNPIGCNVKWKNQDGHWMPPEACDLV